MSKDSAQHTHATERYRLDRYEATQMVASSNVGRRHIQSLEKGSSQPIHVYSIAHGKTLQGNTAAASES